MSGLHRYARCGSLSALHSRPYTSAYRQTLYEVRCQHNADLLIFSDSMISPNERPALEIHEV
jgi:hypothetical protein